MAAHIHHIDRCTAFRVDGRCQLSGAHDGIHALYIGDGKCVSWSDDQSRYWRLPPPPWIIDLPWAAGCQLPVTSWSGLDRR